MNKTCKFVFNICLGLTLLVSSCKKDKEQGLPQVSFERPVSFLSKTDTLALKVYLSAPAQKDVTFSLQVGGSAIPGADFQLLADHVDIPKGEKEGYICIIPKENVVAHREIRLEILENPDYAFGHYKVALIPVETSDILTASFEMPVYTLERSTSILMQLYLGTRVFQRPSEDILVPFIIDPSSTAVLDEHFTYDGTAQFLTMKPGSMHAELRLTALKYEEGKDVIILRLADNKRFLPGMINQTSIKIQAIDEQE